MVILELIHAKKSHRKVDAFIRPRPRASARVPTGGDSE